jgi:ribosome recycling factor
MDLSQTKQRMQQVLEVIKSDLSTVRTGRAAPSLVENIVISTYGGTTKLRVLELATVGAQDPQTLVITPFDPTTIGDIQKGIMETNVGLSPVVDGQIIRISIPPLSEERRRELIHLVNQKLEGGRIQIRQVRHEAMIELKKQNFPEDETGRLEKEIQKLTDDSILEIDNLGKRKEEELMQI